ncbi:hypothetical protein EV182_000640 [Spiromyces aspiralis]|uniref:Uncharacterized protein n=1 Tax=Spiromyces aspiralis TaxID=68401 RepID=A0ACC1HGR2_9FUNG|nr:hypothetical protein EV182_000640 [Spiromyces aspiralis]
MVAATEVADSAATAIAKADAISEQKLYKITLARSTIGMPPDTRRNTEALGLFKRGMVVYRPVCNEIAGMILKIKELVKLELVDEPEQIHKPATKGYTIVRRTKRSQPALVTTEK